MRRWGASWLRQILIASVRRSERASGRLLLHLSTALRIHQLLLRSVPRLRWWLLLLRGRLIPSDWWNKCSCGRLLLHPRSALRICLLLLRDISRLRRVLIAPAKWGKGAAIRLLLLLPAQLIHLLLCGGATGIRCQRLLPALE